MDPGVATLLSFATLWSGFIARPLGGIIFGHLGDRIGRKTTLVITLVMMGLATTGIGLLPTYAQIGIWAPVTLVCLRVIQGIAVGGEWGGAILIASESAPKGKGILYAAFAQQGSPTGNLLATLALRPEQPAHAGLPAMGLAHSLPAFGGAGDRRHGDPPDPGGVGGHAAADAREEDRQAADPRSCASTGW